MANCHMHTYVCMYNDRPTLANKKKASSLIYYFRQDSATLYPIKHARQQKLRM